MSELSDKELREQIKLMEQQKRNTTELESSKDRLVSFDHWFHLRKDKIPARHMKEILVADFKSRGLSDTATMEQFDKTLALYGITLN